MPPLPPSPVESGTVKLSAAVASKSNAPTRLPLGRREKSGVAALDQYMSDAVDEDVDEDDDWVPEDNALDGMHVQHPKTNAANDFIRTSA